MNRLVCPDIPSELRLQIIEAAIKSQIGHWSVTEDHDVHDLAASFFAWPDSVPHTSRDMLERTAATALLRKCIIRIPISSKIGDEPQAFRIPLALKGNESRVSRLVVDVPIFVGTASQVADGLETWIEEADVDGFNFVSSLLSSLPSVTGFANNAITQGLRAVPPVVQRHH